MSERMCEHLQGENTINNKECMWTDQLEHHQKKTGKFCFFL